MAAPHSPHTEQQIHIGINAHLLSGEAGYRRAGIHQYVYQVLRHFDESPQLPNGYAGMIVLALFPPLWRAVMDRRVRAYYAGEEYQLSATQQA